MGIFCRCVSRVHDEWFADEEKVRHAVGLLDKPLVHFVSDAEAEVCLFFFNLFLVL